VLGPQTVAQALPDPSPPDRASGPTLNVPGASQGISVAHSGKEETMKSLVAWMIVPALTLIFASGCGEKRTVTKEGKELTMLKPANQVMAQGETNKVNITIRRTGFEGEVKIDFDNLPRGVSVAEDGRIPPDDFMRAFSLVAADDAPPVEKHVVTVHAKADDLKVTQTFELTVKARAG
jgi:hypothetical protein